MKINPEIFREYDIRGVVNEDLTSEVVKNIGRAFGSYVGKGKVAVGGDNRNSTEEFRKALISGILSAGLDVMDIGIVPTPVLYFALHHYKMAGGIQITGSHNPPQFNGFKVCKGTDTIYGQEIQALYKGIKSKKYNKGKGRKTSLDLIPTYVKFIKKKINLGRRLKVGVDAGNGCAGLVVPQLLRDLGCEVNELYCNLDGNFPHHFPDPAVPANLKELIKKVREEKLDLGIIYDGDVDRMGVVSERGEIIWPDVLMVLFYREILAGYPGASCPIEVKCSQALWEEVERLGGKPQFCRTGHSLIKAKMKEIKAPFCGEMSGHMFFADDYFGFDDAIYASLRLLRILSRTDKRLSELLKGMPRYYSTPEIRIDCPDSKKEEVVSRISKYFNSKYPCINIDGVRVLFNDGWGLLRKSNTSAKLILRFEASTEKRLEEIKDIFIERLKKYPQIDFKVLTR
ncbi:MAG: phosphomannomutase/phosphoglucomutase [Dehalococcoidia bacterium]|nr:MAG: phosphomannomutase/phosphoglucomutase [Dehalococcoidia bacterium]